MFLSCVFILSFLKSVSAALSFSLTSRAFRFDDSDAFKSPATRGDLPSRGADDDIEVAARGGVETSHVKVDKWGSIIRPIWILDRVFDNVTYANAVPQRLRIAFTQDKAVILLNNPRSRPWIK